MSHTVILVSGCLKSLWHTTWPQTHHHMHLTLCHFGSTHTEVSNVALNITWNTASSKGQWVSGPEISPKYLRSVRGEPGPLFDPEVCTKKGVSTKSPYSLYWSCGGAVSLGIPLLKLLWIWTTNPYTSQWCTTFKTIQICMCLRVLRKLTQP